jgi:hypothetical protein
LEDNIKLDIKIMAEHSNGTFGSIKCGSFNSFFATHKRQWKKIIFLQIKMAAHIEVTV